MSLFILLNLIHFILIQHIHSEINFNVEINNETYSLDHEKINNSSKSNQNLYLCEDKKDCITCSFLMYQYAACYWDCDHNQCKTEYSSNSFSFTNDLSSIYKLCSSCDSSSIERMKKNCDSSIIIEEKSKDNKNENINETEIDQFDYSRIDFKGLLCKYFIFNKYGKSESLFHLNITKFFRYINIFVELDYGLYMRHINLKSQKNYEIETVGVNSLAIYIYTPEEYDSQPFSIMYSFKKLKKSIILQVVIFMTATIVVIFSILLILIFIELKKGNMIKHGKKEYNLSVNTLIFNKTKYNPNLFQKFNKKCFFCTNNIIIGNFITQLKCKKHIYHNICLLKWVRQNKLDKTNFFCPLCKTEENKEYNGTNISQEDNNNLLKNGGSSLLNKGFLNNTGLKDLNTIDIKNNKNLNNIIEQKDENENAEDKKTNIIENSNIIDNNNNNYLIRENKEYNKNENEHNNEKQKKDDKKEDEK